MFRSSIRNKLIILLMVTTIVPFGSSIIITYFHTKESLKNQVVEENRNLLYQGKVNLESYINELNGLTLSLYKNPNIVNFLRSHSNENSYQTIGIIKNVLQTILYAEDNIERVQISFVRGEGGLSASKKSAVVFAKNFIDSNKENYEKARESPFNMYIEPIHTRKDPAKNRPLNVISIHRSFTNVPAIEVLAYITLEVRPEKIIKLSENLYNKDTEEFYIVTPKGELIYSSDSRVATNEVKEKWIERLILTKKDKGSLEWKEKSFNGVMIFDRLPEASGGWFLVKAIPYSTLYESVLDITKINIMFGMIGLSLVILATLFVSFKITSPIRILLHNIQEVEAGNMKVHFESLGEDEIGRLGFRFKRMIEKINHLINREYKLELENKTNQLKVLQSQLNPHFLYNALQSIGTVALKNNVPQIYSLVTHLSKIMRYGMNMNEDMVPLIKEINYTRAFFLLQKERFGEQLEFSIDADEVVMQVHVPKMILQPIIENYFKHGFEMRDGVGKIELVCKKEDSNLVIHVRDNGGGVSESRLEEIFQHLKEENKLIGQEESNIGLKNVYVRLKLYYNEQATLLIKNQDEGGLLVTMRLPIDLEGGGHESDHYRR